MQKNNSLIVTLLVFIIILVVYIAFAKRETLTEYTPISQGEQKDDQKQTPEPTPKQYPAFIEAMIESMDTGQITKFTYSGNTYYSVMTNFAVGSGYTIYDENGGVFGGCNASIGPQYDHDYCHNHTNIIEIWSKNKPSWMQ